jgi:hypothetical protein
MGLGWVELSSWGKIYFDKQDDDLGGKLRGILDGRVDADKYVYLNTSLQIPFWDFRPTQWFNDDGWAIMDWDFHLVPLWT